MQTSSVAESKSNCPVKGLLYKSTLGSALSIDRPNVASFMTQWYAFSASVPEILCIAAEKASCEAERKNIVANLYSELGLDTDGPSHPALLSDLIEKATGFAPSPDLVSKETRAFLADLKDMMRNGSAALNAGVMLALEAVAYNILGVLNEILTKSDNRALTNHPYITIHEEVEATHIDNTEENIELHRANIADVIRGYSEMNRMWHSFWDAAFLALVAPHV